MGARPTLVYDAECRLCASSKELIEKWDRRHQIRFLPFQKPEAKQLVPELSHLSCMDAIRFIDSKGEVSAGVDAFRKMLRWLPMGRLLSPLFHIPGFSWLAYRIYGQVAEKRYQWFGRVPSGK